MRSDTDCAERMSAVIIEQNLPVISGHGPVREASSLSPSSQKRLAFGKHRPSEWLSY
jgi:hypothetical protein